MIYKNPEVNEFEISRMKVRNVAENVEAISLGDVSYSETEGGYGEFGKAVAFDVDTDRVLFLFQFNNYISAPGVVIIDSPNGADLMFEIGENETKCLALDSLYYKQTEGEHKGKLLVHGCSVNIYAVAMP